MELTHEFEVPIGADDAFAVLTDIERVAPCMPGATLDEVDGDRFTGRVKVKVGPMQMTYRGTAEMAEKDPAGRRATITARGQETRGGGTAQATVTATLESLAPDRTAVRVHTDLVLTGKPAQFGRGVVADVGDKLLGQFADCLAEELSGRPEPAAAAEAVGVEVAGPEAGASVAAEAGEGSWQPQSEEPPRPGRPTSDTIDLIDLAGRPVLTRLAPVVALLAAAGICLWLRSRRR